MEHFWDTSERPNLPIIVTEGGDIQAKSIENIFNK
jgi:hypothetical protein